MSLPLLTLEVRTEPDIVLSRQRARQIAALMGFAPLDQTRIATAVSEIARNAYQYAGGGRVEFLLDAENPQGFRIRVRQRGQGIDNLQAILDGAYSSPHGLGLGMMGAQRMMDRFEVEESGGGATVTMVKELPRPGRVFSAQELARISGELAQHSPQGPLEELRLQNQELLRTLQELKERQAEIAQLHNRELEETNRGVVALYSELDENAEALRRVSDLKTRFLSNMSHEFRSPLNTILSMSGFLLDGSSGELTPEQEKEIGFIRRAAEGLAALVNDLLDLAKVEAGKAVIRASSFDVADVFDGLRGTTLPLLAGSSVSLVVEAAENLPRLITDEGKLTQILRNFLSNAVKFTDSGVIRLTAKPGPGDTVIFSVADTGIGISPEDSQKIFEEFGQIENPMQGRAKGTGLGLPLSRKLAELLGGEVSVRSEPGVGSTFFAVLPRVYEPPKDRGEPDGSIPALDPSRAAVLVVEDDPVDLLLYERFLEGTGYQTLPARTLDEARRILQRVRPLAILLDIVLEAESGWRLLGELKSQPATRQIPIFVLTVVDGRERASILGADEFCLKPIDRTWLLDRLNALRKNGTIEKVLILDEHEGDRRTIRDLLTAQGPFEILEAVDGEEGIRRARGERPNVILLDLVMPDMTGFQVLDRLRSDDATRDIPIIIYTAKSLDAEERRRLVAGTAAILNKSEGTPEVAFAALQEALVRAGLTPHKSASET